MAGAVMIRRVIRIASSVTSRSSWAVMKLKRIAGGVFGDFDGHMNAAGAFRPQDVHDRGDAGVSSPA